MEVSPQKQILDWFKGDKRFVIVITEETYTTKMCPECCRPTMADSFSMDLDPQKFTVKGKKLNKKVRKKERKITKKKN
jgi:hypothetical protein